MEGNEPLRELSTLHGTNLVSYCSAFPNLGAELLRCSLSEGLAKTEAAGGDVGEDSDDCDYGRKFLVVTIAVVVKFRMAVVVTGEGGEIVVTTTMSMQVTTTTTVKIN